ncbi:MAG: hypothetical protein JSV09_08490 [Thermoplasmata archaeon]|nr:MAG: hypothetical protein JSV09_08490 [Thermoplasmata archaeon]
MRQNIVICGIVLIVIGVVLLGIGVNLATESDDVKGMHAGLRLEDVGVYVTAGGIIAFCVGLFLSDRTLQHPQPTQQPQYPQPPYQQQQYQQPPQQPQYPQPPYQQPIQPR